MPTLTEQVVAIARDAGDAIMEIYATDFQTYTKSDSSPLTDADLAAHRIICEGLARVSSYPILSEESASEEVTWEKRKHWQAYWLVDPLDGTKEFVKKTGEFTVNIALITQGKASLGVVYCPPLKRVYFATQGQGAFRQDDGCQKVRLNGATTPKDDEPWKVIGSKSHGTDALTRFCSQLGSVTMVSMGSSLKLCLVAEGQAHIYPRLAPTCEWDTAAAQAVVEEAGGIVLSPDLSPLLYGQKESLLNSEFVVYSGEFTSFEWLSDLFW